jgi:hypothetical protein
MDSAPTFAQQVRHDADDGLLLIGLAFRDQRRDGHEGGIGRSPFRSRNALFLPENRETTAPKRVGS